MTPCFPTCHGPVVQLSTGRYLDEAINTLFAAILQLQTSSASVSQRRQGLMDGMEIYKLRIIGPRF